MSSEKIITLTLNPALDTSVEIDKVEVNVKSRCSEPRREPGGGGVNVSRALKRLGRNSISIYARGGVTGQMFSDLLDEEDVNQHPLEIEKTTRENLIVREKETDDLYRFVMPGAALSDSELNDTIALLGEYKSADFLVISGSKPPEVPDDFYREIIDKAKEHRIKTIVDTSGPTLKKVCQCAPFLVKPNRQELGAIIEKEISSEGDYENAAKEAMNSYNLQNLVVSMGEAGALFINNDTMIKFPAPSVEKCSNVGAGDSMVAGIVHSLVDGKDLKESVKFGVGCGSAAIKTPGTELLHKSDAEELYNQM